MSFHLEGPWLSTTGKKKGKQRFRNAEAAANSRDRDTKWKELLARHGVKQEDQRKQRGLTAPVLNRAQLSYRGSEQPRIPSLPFTGDVCTQSAQKIYTGNSVIGVTVLHKSCLQPVFSKQEAVDAANMRR